MSSDPFVSCVSGVPEFGRRHRHQAPKELTEEQKRIITDAEDFVTVHRGETDRMIHAQLAEREYFRARTLLAANHWGEAAAASRTLALHYPDTDAGSYGSQYYLMAMSTLGSATEPARPSCYEVVMHDVPTLIQLYCDPKKAKGEPSKTACWALLDVQLDIDRLEAQKLVEAADKAPSDANHPLYARAGERYMILAEACVKNAIARRVKPEDKRCDEVAYNAGASYLAADNVARAGDTVRFMAEPSNGMKDAKLTRRLTERVAHHNQP